MKKFLSALLTSVVVSASALNAAASAVIADASTPRIYVDIVYEDSTTIRADIMFQNVPSTCGGGFHVHVDDGCEVMAMGGSVDISTPRGTTGHYLSVIGSTYDDNSSNDIFIAYASSRGNIDANGHFCSFYVTKTDTYSSTNSDISVYFTSSPGASDGIGARLNGVNNYYFAPGSGDALEAPTIERADEFMIGDATGDWYVNALDASTVLSVLEDYGGSAHQLSVSAIESYYTNYFPNAKAPAAPDANCDGYISQVDADLIINYYTNVSTGGNGIRSVGSRDFYEYYSN